jgi:hypothetical protein
MEGLVPSCPYSPECLERLSGKSRRAPKWCSTQAYIEGQGDRIFALQASDLASLTPLQPSFQTVSRRGFLGSSLLARYAQATAKIAHLGDTLATLGE